MKRRAPDWRCHGVAVLRDVPPGKVPVPIHNPDGTYWREFDLPSELIEAVEQIARKKRRSFNVLMTKAIEAGIVRALRKLRGY